MKERFYSVIYIAPLILLLLRLKKNKNHRLINSFQLNYELLRSGFMYSSANRIPTTVAEPRIIKWHLRVAILVFLPTRVFSFHRNLEAKIIRISPALVSVYI